jgi:hypothetical protein
MCELHTGGNSNAYVPPVLPSARLRRRKARLGALTCTCRHTFQLGGTTLASANYYRPLLLKRTLPAKPDRSPDIFLIPPNPTYIHIYYHYNKIQEMICLLGMIKGGRKKRSIYRKEAPLCLAPQE